MAENKRQNLGRGLNALLGEEPEAKSDSGHFKGSRLVPVERLYPGRYQPRHSIDEELIVPITQVSLEECHGSICQIVRISIDTNLIYQEEWILII